MKRIHIVGRKNSGKTTLIVELIREFSLQGFRVGTIKHTHHDLELDTPGKDSHQHREAGSVAVGILTQRMNAIFWPKSDVERPNQDEPDRYQKFDAMMDDCDIVLVEGDSQIAATKIEVFRTAVGCESLASSDPDIRAVITDDEWTGDCAANDARQSATPTWKRSDLGEIASNILELFGLNTTSE